jgi:ssDNA-binding Zn-finger/Zn-ribbon topoisomerase 1
MGRTYCTKHDVNVDELPGYNHCPKCREERQVEAMEQEMHERRGDPDMHPSVDAPRR